LQEQDNPALLAWDFGARREQGCDGCAFFDSVVAECQSMENLNL